jgi:membrane fusion protein (multidrug efflux system)
MSVTPEPTQTQEHAGGLSPAPEPPEPPRSHGLRVLLALGILAVLAAGVAGYWYFFMRGTVYTDDARLAGHLVDMAPEISDSLVEVRVREGQFVHRGEVLFTLESDLQQAAIAQAQAALESAKANLAASQARYEKTVNGPRAEEVKAAEATAKRLQSDEELARLELDRTEKLAVQGATTEEARDRARAAHESASQSWQNAVQTLALLEEGSRKEDIDAAKADFDLARSRVAEAEAALERARRELDRCTVQAPFDAWVVRRWLDPGAMPLTGQPVVTLFDPATLRVDANIEEKYLHRVEIGDEAQISIDAYPGLKLKGRVTDILRAANSEFSLIPAEGVSGTFIKVTQRVPLRLGIEAPADVRLGPGLSVEVRIRTDARSGSPVRGVARE